VEIIDSKIDPKINKEWKNLLGDEFKKDYFFSLKQFLIEEKMSYKVYPAGSKIFNAFDLTPPSILKVVIIGQDPYHGEAQAHGLCFSVPDGINPPPSLVNIFKELSDDIGVKTPLKGDLTKWALQGVLLLNTTLTVRAHSPLSHKNKGWETFTDSVISAISSNLKGVVFMLWGRHAYSKHTIIDTTKHYILTAPHPSPLSAWNGFFGCKHFSKTNEILRSLNKEPIDWSL